MGPTEQGGRSGFEGPHRRRGCRCNPPPTKHDRFGVDGVRPHSTDMGRQEFGLTLTRPPHPLALSPGVVILISGHFGFQDCTNYCPRVVHLSVAVALSIQTIKRKAWSSEAVRRMLYRVLLKPSRRYLTGSAVRRSLATSFWSSVNPGS